jgi:hypothetical protein
MLRTDSLKTLKRHVRADYGPVMVIRVWTNFRHSEAGQLAASGSNEALLFVAELHFTVCSRRFRAILKVVWQIWTGCVIRSMFVEHRFLWKHEKTKSIRRQTEYRKRNYESCCAHTVPACTGRILYDFQCDCNDLFWGMHGGVWKCVHYFGWIVEREGIG